MFAFRPSLKKTSKHLGSKRWPLSAFARIISFLAKENNSQETCWEIRQGSRSRYRNILFPKAPSTAIATIVSLWPRDLRVNNGKLTMARIVSSWSRGPMIHWVYLFGWSLPSTWLYDTIKIPQYIQNNRGLRNTQNDAPKDFWKRSRKIKSDVVSRIISQKTEASNISIYHIYIYVLYHTILYYIIFLYYIILYYIISYYIILYSYIILYYIISYHIILYYIILYYIILYYIILYHIIFETLENTHQRKTTTQGSQHRTCDFSSKTFEIEPLHLPRSHRPGQGDLALGHFS